MHQLPWPGTKLPFLHMQPFSNNFLSIAFKPRFALSIKPQYRFNHSLSSKCIAWLLRNTRSPFCSQVLLEKMFKPRFNREHASSSPLLTSCVWAHRLSARVSGEKLQRFGKDTVEKAVELHISGYSGCSQGVPLAMAKSEHLWALSWSRVSSPEWGHCPWAKAES